MGQLDAASELVVPPLNWRLLDAIGEALVGAAPKPALDLLADPEVLALEHAVLDELVVELGAVLGAWLLPSF